VRAQIQIASSRYNLPPFNTDRLTMKRLIAFSLLAVSFAFSAHAASSVDDAADRLILASVKEDVAPSDPRLAQTRVQLNKAAKLTAEEPAAVAVACVRYAGHLHDSAHLSATPLDLLEALSRFGKAGKPMNQTLQDYATARKATPARSHAEALAAMGQSK
jgi:hypothetical protein